MAGARGAPWNPAASRWRRRAWTSGVWGPAGRRTVSPTRTTPSVTSPPISGISGCCPAGAVELGGGGHGGAADGVAHTPDALGDVSADQRDLRLLPGGFGVARGGCEGGRAVV